MDQKGTTMDLCRAQQCTPNNFTDLSVSRATLGVKLSVCDWQACANCREKEIQHQLEERPYTAHAAANQPQTSATTSSDLQVRGSYVCSNVDGGVGVDRIKDYTSAENFICLSWIFRA